MAHPDPVKLSLKDILPWLDEVSNDFFRLGLFLGIKEHKVKEIENEHKYDGLQRKLSEVISLWLKTSTDDCSWKTLAKAVENLGSQYKKLASKLSEMEPAEIPEDNPGINSGN